MLHFSPSATRDTRTFLLDDGSVVSHNAATVFRRASSGVRRVYQVVLVEDHVDTRQMTAELLSCAGYDVRDFADGAAALEYLLAARKPPSIVVTDLMMPRMNGYQLVRAIKEHPKLSAIPVLVVTANKGFELNGVSVLAKPVGKDALLAKIATLTASASGATGSNG